jgi:DNA polymerase
MTEVDITHGSYKCCPLYKTRKNIVWYRGTSTKNVDVLFVGEAPGKDEDIQGKPFVGKAGKILDRWISDAQISKYAIVNVIKCRPPNNRKPYVKEIRACVPHLIKQIHDMNPKIIVALGGVACSVLIHRTDVLQNIGKVFVFKHMAYKNIDNASNNSKTKIIVFPHPSYILRGAHVDVPIEKLKDMQIQITDRCQV